ncbi:MAG: FkbM family methyltransferase [Sphingomonadales bacterium]|nr:FkbM family methyltransferase [Sphingomonadales bacterium]
MRIYHYIQRIAAMCGVHVEKLYRRPSETVMGLVGRPVDLILDVGANVGQFAQEMRGKFPRAHIISFEPLPEPFAALDAWAKADGNATAVNIGLGERDGTMPFHRHVDHSASSSMLTTHATGAALFPQMQRSELVEVSVRRLDDILAGMGCKIDHNTLLKLDVQGFRGKGLARRRGDTAPGRRVDRGGQH